MVSKNIRIWRQFMIPYICTKLEKKIQFFVLFSRNSLTIIFRHLIIPLCLSVQRISLTAKPICFLCKLLLKDPGKFYNLYGEGTSQKKSPLEASRGVTVKSLVHYNLIINLIALIKHFKVKGFRGH